MAYIDTLRNIGNIVNGEPIRPTEGEFINDFLQLIKPYGYSLETSFMKAVYPFSTIIRQRTLKGEDKVQLAVAKHHIFRAPKGYYFGIAYIATWSEYFGLIPDPKISREELHTWMFARYRDNVEKSIMYIYLIENIEKLDQDIAIAWNGDLVRAALDAEIDETRAEPIPGSTNDKLVIDKGDLDRMQSQIIESKLRDNRLIDRTTERHSFPLALTNWWYDSNISVQGYVDEEAMFFILNADPAPNWVNGSVPTVPLYIGRMKTNEFDPYDKGCVLISGTYWNPNSDDPDNASYKGKMYMPLLKDYMAFPGNSVDNVIVSRGAMGGRYMAHFLSWDAPSNLTPPKRENSGKKHPRAWAINFQTNMYKTQFNPSAYDDRIHSSKVYVVHPEEGVRGELRHCIAFPPINVSAQKIKVREPECTNDKNPKYDTFRYHLIEGFSPFTKRPGTHYRPAGVGIYYRKEDRQGDEI